MSTICLNMIVKNESHIIERCLTSLIGHIDYWVISDTGSTDGTQEIIQNFFKAHHIPGELIENTWINFAHNRNIALHEAVGKCDYTLIMDADDYLVSHQGFTLKQDLTADTYMLKALLGNTQYHLPRLIRSNLPWHWTGVLHEYLSCDEQTTTELMEGNYAIMATTEGARGQSATKYEDDAALLEQALVDEPDNARYRFYLAQSYRDCEQYEKALENYRIRAGMGGWPEEVYYALYEIGRCKQALKYDLMQILNDLNMAYLYRPQRLEALHEAVRLCRLNGLFATGFALGINASKTPFPRDILFLDRSVYEWRFTDEVSICAANTGQREIALKMMNHLLDNGYLPEDQVERVTANLKFVTH